MSNSMFYCGGLGKCLEDRDCFCTCIGTAIKCKCGHEHLCSDACTCGHKPHNGYCPSPWCLDYCTPRMCWNHQICGEYAPQYVLNLHNGMTPRCEAECGRITFLDITAYCALCGVDKLQIQLDCKHVYCRDCYRVDIIINHDWDSLTECTSACDKQTG